MVELKNKQLQRKDEEVKVFKTQIEKLVEELREKSDSESFEDDKEKLLNVQKALEADRLKTQVKNMQAEARLKEEESRTNLDRLENQLKFSRDANASLKNDYDLFQDKFDKNMKATNNINADLKEEIQELTSTVSKL